MRAGGVAGDRLRVEEMKMSETGNINRARAEIDRMKAELRRIQEPPGAADAEALEAAHVKADAIYCMHGERAPLPIAGESPLQFRRRMLNGIKQHSPRYRDEPVFGLGPVAIEAVERQVYQDAADASGDKPGFLVAHKERDESGRTITKWYGDPACWMGHFTLPGAVGYIVRDPPQR